MTMAGVAVVEFVDTRRAGPVELDHRTTPSG
jgi:hypothetical protein